MPGVGSFRVAQFLEVPQCQHFLIQFRQDERALSSCAICSCFIAAWLGDVSCPARNAVIDAAVESPNSSRACDASAMRPLRRR